MWFAKSPAHKPLFPSNHFHYNSPINSPTIHSQLPSINDKYQNDKLVWEREQRFVLCIIMEITAVTEQSTSGNATRAGALLVVVCQVPCPQTSLSFFHVSTSSNHFHYNSPINSLTITFTITINHTTTMFVLTLILLSMCVEFVLGLVSF